MINKNKYDVLLTVLHERGLSFEESYHCPLSNVVIDLFVPKLGIAIFDGDSQEKYVAVRRLYAPIFVRESETEEKTKEKLVNTIVKRTSFLRQKKQRMKTDEARKRYAMECEERHQKNLARREAYKKRKEEAENKKAEKRKRQRIVRYEKV